MRRQVIEPPALDDVRELLVALAADDRPVLLAAARYGVPYDGPGTEWQPPPLPAAERIDRPVEVKRESLPRARTIVVREEPGPPGPLGPPYWTAERLAYVRDRLRGCGLRELRPGVFQWRPSTGGSCEPRP